jgi:hypothetical protein
MPIKDTEGPKGTWSTFKYLNALWAVLASLQVPAYTSGHQGTRKWAPLYLLWALILG